MELSALVAPLRADVVSGAAVIGRTAADVVRRAVGRIDVDDPARFRAALDDLAVKILDAQPAMAPLVALTTRVLNAAESATSVEEMRRSVSEEAARFRDRLDSGSEAVAARAREMIPDDRPVLTLSASSTVRTALERAARERSGLRVVCLESRPVSEGRALAEKLGRVDGITVTYGVDVAAGPLVQGCGLVLLGADSVGDRGVVNKIGSRALVLLARESGVPVRVLVDRTKLLPPGFPQPTDDDRPGEEVWKRPPAGVRIWNRYFEAVPVSLIGGVVTEEGLRTPDEVERDRAAQRVPEVLKRWAVRAGGSEASRTKQKTGA